MFDYSSVSRRVGLAAVGTAGLLSAISTCALLCYILFCVTMGANRSPMAAGVRSFVRSVLGRYLVALLASEFVQGSAFAMNYYWAAIGAMPEGRACRAQGIVSQFGDFGSALFSLAITFHTFSLLFLQRKPAEWVCWAVMFLVVLWMFLLPVLGSTIIPNSHKRGEFWGSTGAWCWVSEHYQTERYTFVYMWIFINLICSGVLYSMIYLKFKGIIEYDPSRRDGKRLAFNGWNSSRRWTGRGTAQQSSSSSLNESQSSDDRGNPAHVSKALIKIARRLMWYPIVYTLVVVPVSICRLGVIAGWEPPFGLLAFAGVCFSSSGLTNALLFVFTRHAFIQRMTRPPGIRITTHKLTVTTEADNLVRLKTVALDEYAESVATPRQLTDSVHYTVTFDDGANWARPESNASEQGVAKSYAL